jgi:hypothetical protein
MADTKCVPKSLLCIYRVLVLSKHGEDCTHAVLHGIEASECGCVVSSMVPFDDEGVLVQDELEHGRGFIRMR